MLAPMRCVVAPTLARRAAPQLSTWAPSSGGMSAMSKVALGVGAAAGVFTIGVLGGAEGLLQWRCARTAAAAGGRVQPLCEPYPGSPRSRGLPPPCGVGAACLSLPTPTLVCG
jgi:hypothetical protein